MFENSLKKILKKTKATLNTHCNATLNKCCYNLSLISKKILSQKLTLTEPNA